MASFESIVAFFDRCMDKNVSQTVFLSEMSDYIDENYPSINLQDSNGKTVMSYAMKCDSRILTNLILSRGYKVRSCDVKEAIRENLNRDVLWSLVRGSKIAQCCGAQLVGMAAQFQQLYTLDLLFDVGLVFPKQDLHILFKFWDKSRLETGLKYKIVERIIKLGYQVTAKDILFAPKKKSRNDRTSILNLLKENNVPQSLFEISKKKLKYQVTMHSSRPFKETITQLDLPKTVLKTFYYNG